MGNNANITVQEDLLATFFGKELIRFALAYISTSAKLNNTTFDGSSIEHISLSRENLELGINYWPQ